MYCFAVISAASQRQAGPGPPPAYRLLVAWHAGVTWPHRHWRPPPFPPPARPPPPDPNPDPTPPHPRGPLALSPTRRGGRTPAPTPAPLPSAGSPTPVFRPAARPPESLPRPHTPAPARCASCLSTAHSPRPAEGRRVCVDGRGPCA